MRPAHASCFCRETAWRCGGINRLCCASCIPGHLLPLCSSFLSWTSLAHFNTLISPFPLYFSFVWLYRSTTNQVLHLFQRMTDEDAELLWMDARVGRPENLIIENLLVRHTLTEREIHACCAYCVSSAVYYRYCYLCCRHVTTLLISKHDLPGFILPRPSWVIGNEYQQLFVAFPPACL